MYNLTMPEVNNNDLLDFELPPKSEPTGELKKEVKPAIPEQLPEIPEKKVPQEVKPLEKVEAGRVGEKATPATTPPVRAIKTLPHYQEVEKILEANLGEVFQTMPPQKQQEFKIKGEETTAQITKLLNTAKVKFSSLAKQIFGLIINWLKVISGVNKFFLEQEAKIKSDKILALKKKQ